MGWGWRGRRGTRQVLIIEQVAVIRRDAFHRQRRRDFTFVRAAHAVQLQICVKKDAHQFTFITETHQRYGNSRAQSQRTPQGQFMTKFL